MVVTDLRPEHSGAGRRRTVPIPGRHGPAKRSPVCALAPEHSYDNHAQVINARIIVEALDGDGTVTKRTYRDFLLRYVHHWEMHHLLTTCGFDESSFDEASTEMVWVAKVLWP